MKTEAFLDMDLTSLVPTLPLFRKWKVQGGVLLDELEWRAELESCKRFDAVVYTANGAAVGKCRRLLTAKIWGEFPASCEVRQAANVHTKLYIVKAKGWDWEDAVWVGSRNLVLADSYHNVMVRVDDPGQRDTLMLYFKRLWALARPLTISTKP